MPPWGTHSFPPTATVSDISLMVYRPDISALVRSALLSTTIANMSVQSQGQPEHRDTLSMGCLQSNCIDGTWTHWAQDHLRGLLFQGGADIGMDTVPHASLC